MSCLIFAIVFVECVSKHAAGSGIPQVKAIMSGVNLPDNLTIKTMVARIFGMVGMLNSGMSVGKEGPFVHIASCISNTLPYREMKCN